MIMESTQQTCAKNTGTREWARVNVNCVSGCAHDCAYCYAKQMAIRFKRKTAENWKLMDINKHEVNRRRSRVEGVIMFPTTHDLIPEDPSFEPCLTTLRHLLEAHNRVLLVSKAHRVTMNRITELFPGYADLLEIRVTIGSLDPITVKKWEPAAPSPTERLSALKIATDAGFSTSVSMEPILDSDPIQTLRLFTVVEPLITGAAWLGPMNHTANPVKPDLLSLYVALKEEPKARFKDAFLKRLGYSSMQPEDP
jgi:DNA repair photolyase